MSQTEEKNTKTIVRYPILEKLGIRKVERVELRQEFITGKATDRGNPELVLEERQKSPLALDKLERIFRMDGLVFASINKLGRDILEPEFYFDGPYASDFKEFAEQIRLKRALRPAIQDAFVFGNGFLEIVLNKAGNKILKLNWVNAKNMDFQRDSQNNVLLDDAGEPVGFIYTTWRNGTKETFKVPRGQILHIKFYSLGDNPLGMSPLEPLYKIIVNRLNLEDASGEAIFRRGYPIPVAKIGDAEHEPSTNAIDALSNDLSKLTTKSNFVFPYYYSLDWLETPQLPDISALYLNMVQMVCSGLGVPSFAFLPPAARMNNATIEAISTSYEKTIAGFQDSLAEQVENQLLTFHAQLKNIKKIPQMKFKEFSPAIGLSRARRLSTLARAKLLTPDEGLEAKLRTEEGLPELDLDKILPTALPAPSPFGGGGGAPAPAAVPPKTAPVPPKVTPEPDTTPQQPAKMSVELDK